MASKTLPQQLKWEDADNKWAAIINPLLKSPTNNVSILKSVSLISGVNNINHLLGAPLQGWFIVRMRSSALSIADTQDSNPTPQLTLMLLSSGSGVVDIAVF